MNLLIAAACLWFFQPVAGLNAQAAGAPLGSFDISPLYPLTLGMAPFSHGDARILPSGALTVATTGIWSNTFRFDPNILLPGTWVDVDGDAVNQRMTLSLGLGGGLQVWLSAEGTVQFPGAMNGFLDYFHKLFGFPNQNREKKDHSQLSILVENTQGILISVSELHWGLSSLVMGLQWQLPAAFPLAWKVSLRPPIGISPSFMFSGKASLQTSMIYNAEWEMLAWGLSAGLAWQDVSELSSAFAYRSVLGQYGAHLFIYLTKDFFIGAEAAYTQSPIDSKEQFLGGGAGNVWLGGKIHLGSQWVLEAAIIEEFLSWASIEVGFHIGIALFSGKK